MHVPHREIIDRSRVANRVEIGLIDQVRTMANFSGSAADMLKSLGVTAPERQPQSSLEEAQAAKKKMEAEKVCTDAGCTEDHTHGHAHAHNEHPLRRLRRPPQ